MSDGFMASSAQLRALEHPNVIGLVLEYAGPHQWLFFGGVCKAWAAVLAPLEQLLSKLCTLQLALQLLQSPCAAHGTRAGVMQAEPAAAKQGCSYGRLHRSAHMD
jgi:hypothetical protein